MQTSVDDAHRKHRQRRTQEAAEQEEAVSKEKSRQEEDGRRQEAEKVAQIEAAKVEAARQEEQQQQQEIRRQQQIEHDKAVAESLQRELDRQQREDDAAARSQAQQLEATRNEELRQAEIDRQQQAQAQADYELMNWYTTCEALRRANSAMPITAEDKRAPTYKLARCHDLVGDEVSHAIAALIVGISQQGLKNGLASDGLQQAARFGKNHPFYCLKSPNKFVVPLLLSRQIRYCGEEEVDGRILFCPDDRGGEDASLSDCQRAGEVGHWLLIVATKNMDKIDLKIMNSSLNHGPERTVRAAARTMVRNSGWLNSESILFDKEDWVTGPQQGRVANTCGIFVILNAWADLLSLKVNDSPRFNSDLNEKFFDQARELINRALIGQTTAVEIEAWLYSRQYVTGSQAARHHQLLNDNEVAVSMRASTVRMNVDILDAYLASETEQSSGGPSSTNLNELSLGSEHQMGIEDDDTSLDAGYTTDQSTPANLAQNRKSPAQDDGEDDSDFSFEELRSSDEAASRANEDDSGHGTNWTVEERVRAFALLTREQLEEIAKGHGILTKSRRNLLTYAKDFAWISSIPVPEGDYLEHRDTVRWPNSTRESLMDFSIGKLQSESNRLAMSQLVGCVRHPVKGDERKIKLIKFLLDYQANRFDTRISDVHRTVHVRAPRNTMRIEAIKRGMSYRVTEAGKRRRLTGQELKEAVDAYDNREKEREELLFDDKLPSVTFSTSRPILLILSCRFSGTVEPKSREDVEIDFDEMTSALRKGHILSGLQDADTLRLIWSSWSLRRHPPTSLNARAQDTPGSTPATFIRKLQESKGEREVVILLCGIEGLSSELEGWSRLVNAFPRCRFTLLIGESIRQWHLAEVTWSFHDWREPLLGRYWTHIDLIDLLEYPERCRLYRGIIEQWQRCSLGRGYRSMAIAAEKRPIMGRKRRKV